jgi:LmbE family N-acetylglucosaminyl deacetylase
MRLLSRGELTFLTCFTHSLYAPFTDAAELSAEAVRAIRTAEDREYARRIGARYIDLGLEDVTVRFSDEEDWICACPVKDDAYVGSVERIASAISSEYTHILCPLAVGHNVDHIITRDAVQRAISVNQRILYYEDLPYGARVGGPAAVLAHARLVIPGGKMITIDVTGVIEDKMSDIKIYQSQIYPEDLAGVAQYAAEIAGAGGFGERFWSDSR